jgi:hypothetical protein
VRIFSFFLLTGLVFLSSCYKNHLYVRLEKVDASDLASSHVQTPDYRQKKPPTGQRIIVSWDFPFDLFEKKLSLFLTVRFWDNTQKLEIFSLEKSRGTKSFFFSNPGFQRPGKILTYKIQIVTPQGEMVENWEHQLWTYLIDIDKETEDRVLSAQDSSPDVSSHPRQGSVIETP